MQRGWVVLVVVVAASCRGGGGAEGRDAVIEPDDAVDDAYAQRDASADATPDAAPDASIDAAPTVVQHDLVFTRGDGTVVPLGPNAAFRVSCGPFDGTIAPDPSLRIIHYTSSTEPFWYLKVVRNDVVIGTPHTFPNTYLFNQPKETIVFLNEETPNNEVATSDGDSSGSITYQSLDCSGTVSFTIDAVLGSELAGGSSVTVEGSFSATGIGTH